MQFKLKAISRNLVIRSIGSIIAIRAVKTLLTCRIHYEIPAVKGTTVAQFLLSLGVLGASTFSKSCLAKFPAIVQAPSIQIQIALSSRNSQSLISGPPARRLTTSSLHELDQASIFAMSIVIPRK